MTLPLVFIACAFTLFTIYKMIAPFLEERDEQIRSELLDEELREIELLVARKSALLLALRDIEYDWETAKISEEDYTRFKRSCERQAVAVMRRLDAIHGGRGWEVVIDEELARRLAEHSPDDETSRESSEKTRTPAQSVDLPVLDKSTASELPCTTCGAMLATDDLFCSKCGTPVATAASTVPDEPDATPDLTHTNVDSPTPEAAR